MYMTLDYEGYHFETERGANVGVKVGEKKNFSATDRGERDEQATMVFPSTQRLLEYGDGP